jgi:hypothetical protein
MEVPMNRILVHALRAVIVAVAVTVIAMAIGPAFAVDGHAIVQMGRAFHPGEVTIARGESLVIANHDTSSTRST